MGRLQPGDVPKPGPCRVGNKVYFIKPARSKQYAEWEAQTLQAAPTSIAPQYYCSFSTQVCCLLARLKLRTVYIYMLHCGYLACWLCKLPQSSRLQVLGKRQYFLVTEYIPTSLAARLPQEPQLWSAAIKALRTLGCCGLVHGDLKPQHFMLRDDDRHGSASIWYSIANCVSWYQAMHAVWISFVRLQLARISRTLQGSLMIPT